LVVKKKKKERKKKTIHLIISKSSKANKFKKHMIRLKDEQKGRCRG
jgi:hypothetical protein